MYAYTYIYRLVYSCIDTYCVYIYIHINIRMYIIPGRICSFICILYVCMTFLDLSG